MLKRNFGKVIVPLVLLYIAVGDLFLPENIGIYSRKTRETVNSYLVSLFPDKEIESPYGKTEEAIEQMEQKKRGN